MNNLLKLVSESCTLYYDIAGPIASDGVKPITLMVEDFDRNGKVRSSIPAQFLAVIWTPDENQIGNQQGESGIKRLMLEDETR